MKKGGTARFHPFFVPFTQKLFQENIAAIGK